VRRLGALYRSPDDQLRRFRCTRLTVLELLGQQVAEHHDSRWVPAGEDRQLPEGIARIKSLAGEPIGKIGEQILKRQWAESQRIGLPE
jgi:hypothetical protein